MANRNSMSLTLPGNPLGSVLREVAREARRSTRDSGAVPNATEADLQEVQGDVLALQQATEMLQSQVATLQSQVAALQNEIVATTIVTGAGGIGAWVFPAPFGVVPSLVATPRGGAPYHCNILAPTTAGTQVLVLDAAGVGVVGATVSIVAVSLG